jgi:Rrf2 family iron-sulfur cluster assembly transcriptional regulator
VLLAQTPEYALRAMAQLAAVPRGEAVTARALSELTFIPPHYVSKVMRRLVRKGLLKAEKGHGGGFRLARAPARIRLADVLDAVDGRLDERRCAFGWGSCDARRPCPLHHAHTALNARVGRWARDTTLEDLVPRGRRSRR